MRKNSQDDGAISESEWTIQWCLSERERTRLKIPQNNNWKRAKMTLKVKTSLFMMFLRGVLRVFSFLLRIQGGGGAEKEIKKFVGIKWGKKVREREREREKRQSSKDKFCFFSCLWFFAVSFKKKTNHEIHEKKHCQCLREKKTPELNKDWVFVACKIEEMVFSCLFGTVNVKTTK